MKLKPGLGASYTIHPGNGVGLLLWTHTGSARCRLDMCNVRSSHASIKSLLYAAVIIVNYYILHCFRHKMKSRKQWPCFFPLLRIRNLHNVLLRPDTFQCIQRREFNTETMLVNQLKTIVSKYHIRNMRQIKMCFESADSVTNNPLCEHDRRNSDWANSFSTAPSAYTGHSVP